MRFCEFASRFRSGHNVQMTWPELVERLKEVTRTQETMAEYKAMKKTRQSDIKDVGGFVGGYVTGGRRSKETVTGRDLLVLDMDYACQDCVLDVTEALMPSQWMLFPTHSSRPESPRMRLVVPLARTVTPDEYEPLARAVAAEIGIDQFDDTSYQASRLMYWPSVPRDAEYDPVINEGEPLDPDKILATYVDWHDVSAWPVSSRSCEVIRRNVKRQKDPLEKPGAIGAFCRHVSIQQAIGEYLPEVYTAAGDGRWTYAAGTTFGGAVVYEDKFLYSNHATDPASCQLCNAFDLVRIHRFRDLDEDAKEDTPANKLPSFLAMCDLAMEIPAVKQEVVAERIQGEDDFAEELKDTDWVVDLETDRKGNVQSTIRNVVIILEHDPVLAGNVGGTDQMLGDPVKLGPLPWEPDAKGRPWVDDDDRQLRLYLEEHYRIKGKAIIEDGLGVVHQSHAFHPVKDLIESRTWDGTCRVDTFFTRHYGVPDEPYSRAVARKFFTAAVARIYEPGVKWDFVPILIGEQGIGKSEMVSRLFQPWSTDTLTSLTGKDAYEALSGNWGVELAELTVMRKSDDDQIKQFISSKADKYRKAYDKRKTNAPRQCVFIGTTNNPECLRDMTGNRRYWPLICSEEDMERSIFTVDQEERLQLWAEARHLYQAGEKLYLDKEMEVVARERQREQVFIPARWQDIENYLEKPLPADWYQRSPEERRAWAAGLDGDGAPATLVRDTVCAKEIWVELFGGSTRDFRNADQREIKDCLRYLGWEQVKDRITIRGYGRQKGFKKPAGMLEKREELLKKY